MGHFEYMAPMEALLSASVSVLFCPILLPIYLLGLLEEGRVIDWRSLPAVEFGSNPIAYVALAVFMAAIAICGSLYSVAFTRAVVRRVRGKPGGLSIRRSHL